MLEYESPTALTTRPTVVLRQIPGKTIRVPARSGTLLVLALIIWGVAALALPVAWYVLATAIGAPAALLAALAEWKPGGKAPLAWALAIARQRARAGVQLPRRLAPLQRGR